MNYSAIILCAGKGSRSGLDYNKMLYRFGNQTVYQMTMKTFLNDPRCKQLVVVTKADEITDLKQLVTDKRIVYVYGGKERQDSVYNGLQVVDQDHVLIHDGARPYITTEKIDDLLLCLKEYDACLLMVPVEVTLPRARLMQAQTPQAFKTSLIKVCYQQAQDSGFIATDDASLVEEFSTAPVKVVIGSYENIKITTPEDL